MGRERVNRFDMKSENESVVGIYTRVLSVNSGTFSMVSLFNNL